MCWETGYDFYAEQRAEEFRRRQQRAGVIDKLRREAVEAGATAKTVTEAVTETVTETATAAGAAAPGDELTPAK